jgi:site-specific recombinase XerD
MIENDVSLKVVSELLGHFSVSITGDIYAHVSPDVSAQAMDALGAALDG